MEDENILVAIQIMFATHQYILEGMAVLCPYNLLSHFSFKLVLA
ncbi:hypothetical protein FDUTEX481_05440 [Tolypothrix sp. PCC 7601]|nr:hypothetical protein FDUTEX481_05440 [Tolypothrix sp. PCC 7601]